MTATDPMNGPFLTASQLLDSSDDPGYAILLPSVPEGRDLTARVLDRLDRARRILAAEGA